MVAKVSDSQRYKMSLIEFRYKKVVLWVKIPEITQTWQEIALNAKLGVKILWSRFRSLVRKPLKDKRPEKFNTHGVQLRCFNCLAMNGLRQFDCYNCGQHLGNLGQFQYKYGKSVVSFAQQRKLDDDARGHEADHLQPTYWDKQEHKFKKNPDFYKVYGDVNKLTANKKL